MIYCPKCGTAQAPDARRCPNCKTRIRASRKDRKAAERESAATSGRELRRAEGTTADALGYEAMYANGTCRVSKGTYSRTVEFDDANFQSARESEQVDVLNAYCELLNAVDDDILIKVQIYAQAIDLDVWRDEMFMPEVEEDDAGNRYRAELNSIIEMRMAESRQNVRRRRFMTFTCSQPTKEKADPVLARTCESAIRLLKNMGVEAREMSGVERLRLIDSVTNPQDGPDAVTYEALKDAPGLTTRDLVAPPTFERDRQTGATRCAWGRSKGCGLYVQKYANSVKSDLVAKLAELPINQIITLNLDCWDQTEARETIEGRLTDLKVQKTEYVRKHSQQIYITDEMLPADMQDAILTAEEIRGDLVSRDQKYWGFSMTSLTWADTDEALEHNIDEVQNVVRGHNMRMEPMVGLQLEAFRNSLPVGYNGVPQGWDYNMTTAGAANFMPLTSVEINDAHGQWYGYNQISKNFIFYNRRASSSPNGFILGKPGRGKSVQAKLSIINTLLADPDSEVIVLDPEREYIALADAFGGEVVKISSDSDTFINPFDLEFDREDNGGLGTKVDAVISIIDEMCKGLTAMQQTLVDRTCSQVYADYFETRDTEDIPTLVDFMEALRSQPEGEGAILATTIERYVTGQANVFAHRTNVDTQSRFVVYDIRDLADNLKGLGMLILLDATWQRIVRNQARGVRTWVFIDELQLLLDNDFTVSYFDRLWTRSRKYGAVPTGITQNVERLLLNEKTRLMVGNSDFLVILGQSATDAAALGQVLTLSGQQVATIRGAGVGEGLICADGRIVPFANQLPKDTELYKVTTTKLEDVAELRRAAEKGA